MRGFGTRSVPSSSGILLEIPQVPDSWFHYRNCFIPIRGSRICSRARPGYFHIDWYTSLFIAEIFFLRGCWRCMLSDIFHAFRGNNNGISRPAGGTLKNAVRLRQFGINLLLMDPTSIILQPPD